MWSIGTGEKKKKWGGLKNLKQNLLNQEKN